MCNNGRGSETNNSVRNKSTTEHGKIAYMYQFSIVAGTLCSKAGYFPDQTPSTYMRVTTPDHDCFGWKTKTIYTIWVVSTRGGGAICLYVRQLECRCAHAATVIAFVQFQRRPSAKEGKPSTEAISYPATRRCDPWHHRWMMIFCNHEKRNQRKHRRNNRQRLTIRPSAVRPHTTL